LSGAKAEGTNRVVTTQILNYKNWTVEQKLSGPRTANYSFHQSVDSWYFAEISALELSAGYGLLKCVVLP